MSSPRAIKRSILVIAGTNTTFAMRNARNHLWVVSGEILGRHEPSDGGNHTAHDDRQDPCHHDDWRGR